MLERVWYAVACETESETYTFTIEQIKDRIQNFKQLKIWTPFYASLTFLEEWYKRLKEVSQRVIAKVTKIRLIHRSRLVDKMMNSADFELRVNCEGCEITVKKTNRDRGYIQNRSKRDKKKNPYLANGINLGLMDHKPTKQNKELIEEIDFNDYEEKAELLCFCNRRRLPTANFSQFRQDDPVQHL